MLSEIHASDPHWSELSSSQPNLNDYQDLIKAAGGVEYQEGGCHVQNLDLWRAWQAINSLSACC